MKGFIPSGAWMIACETCLFSFLVVSLLQLSDAKAAFNDSFRNAKYCDQLRSDIATLRSMSSVADERQSGEELTNSQIIRVAADCGMAENQVTSIQRMAPLKMDGTDYQREDIAIDFRSASMQELIQFGLEMERLRGTSKLTQIILRHQPTAGRRSDAVVTTPEATERWNAELILTQLVFVATRTTE